MYSKPFECLSISGKREYAFLAGLPIGEKISFISWSYFLPSLAASERKYFAL